MIMRRRFDIINFAHALMPPLSVAKEWGWLRSQPEVRDKMAQMRRLVADTICQLRREGIPEERDCKRFAACAKNGGVLPANWFTAGGGGGTPALIQ